MDVSDEIRKWSRELFPRGFGVKIGSSYVRMGLLLNIDELFALLKRVNRDVYVNVFSVGQIENNVYDTFLLDIDSHLYDPKTKSKYELSLETTYDRMREVTSKLEDAGLNYRVYFSGRGFHIYVDYVPVEIKRFSETALRYMAIVLDDVFGYVDTRVLVDKNRIARVPYTKNSTVDRYMIGIDPDWDILTIIDYSENGEGKPQRIRPVDISDELRLIDERIEDKYNSREYEELAKMVRESDVNGDLILKIASDPEKMPYCVRDAIRRLVMTGELDHYERMHVAAFLLRLWNFDDVHELFKFANDYRERITLYQLNYIMRRGIMPFSCRKAQTIGVCNINQDECLWKKITTGWIGSLFVDFGVEEYDKKLD